MDAFEPNMRGLVIFAAFWSVCCASFVQLAGMLPLSQAPAPLKTWSGALLIFVNAALLMTLLALTLVFSYRELRWSSAVVAGGAIFLFSPFVTDALPDAFKDGKAGLLVLFLLLLIALGILLSGVLN